MGYTPSTPSAEERKKWVCKFSLASTTENVVQSIMSEWRGDLSERPEEVMKKDVEETVMRCFEHLKNCTIQVYVLKYNKMRNTWPIYTIYDSHTRTWSY